MAPGLLRFLFHSLLAKQVTWPSLTSKEAEMEPTEEESWELLGSTNLQHAEESGVTG